MYAMEPSSETMTATGSEPIEADAFSDPSLSDRRTSPDSGYPDVEVAVAPLPQAMTRRATAAT
jgi:hypothetical protein